MQQLSLRRGDTLYAACQLVDELGAAAAITGFEVEASLIDRGGNVAYTFTTTIQNENMGMFALEPCDTSEIPASLYTLQIKYLAEQVTISATSFELLILKTLTTEPVRFAQVSSVIGNTRVLITVPASIDGVTTWDEAWDEVWSND